MVRQYAYTCARSLPESTDIERIDYHIIMFLNNPQVIATTHFLDASLVYGATGQTAGNLRSFRAGRMRAQLTRDGRMFMPNVNTPTQSCNVATNSEVCYRAGEPYAAFDLRKTKKRKNKTFPSAIIALRSRVSRFDPRGKRVCSIIIVPSNCSLVISHFAAETSYNNL